MSRFARVDNGELEPRYVKCVFLGYKNGVKGYKFWCPKTRKIIVSRDVIFYETTMFQDLPTNDFHDSSQQKSGIRVELQIRTKPASKSTPHSLSNEQDAVGSSQQSSSPYASQYNITRDRESVTPQIIP